MTTSVRQTPKDAAIDRLRDLLKPGDTVFTIVKDVSRDGMARSIDLYKFSIGQHRRIEPYWLSSLTAQALGRRFDTKNQAVRVHGVGMDMTFELVYSLSHTLFPDGFECLGDESGNRCPSNDHSNGDRDYTPHHHSSGGYALRREKL